MPPYHSLPSLKGWSRSRKPSQQSPWRSTIWWTSELSFLISSCCLHISSWYSCSPPSKNSSVSFSSDWILYTSAYRTSKFHLPETFTECPSGNSELCVLCQNWKKDANKKFNSAIKYSISWRCPLVRDSMLAGRKAHSYQRHLLPPYSLQEGNRAVCTQVADGGP